MTRKSKFSPEVSEWAVRLVERSLPSHEREWAVIPSSAKKMGCTPRSWRGSRRACRPRGTR
jgi:hypothetical protein